MNVRGFALVMGLVTVLVAGGCGGGDASSGQQAPEATGTTVAGKEPSPNAGGTPGQGGEKAEGTLTKAQFIQKADQICKAGERKTQLEIQLNAANYGIQKGQKPTPPQEEALLVEFVLPNIKEQARKLAALPAPVGEEQAVRAIIAAIDQGVAAAEQTPSKALGKPGVFGQLRTLADEFGLKVCGQ